MALTAGACWSFNLPSCCEPHDRGAVLQGSKLAPACSAAGLQSFPTWIIKGEKVEGEQSFDTLEGLLAAK
jgi:hypothetical protein